MIDGDVVAGPRTHALVIGVGDYDHLPGGKGQPADATIGVGMGQLGSPVPSALALAEWLRTGFSNPAAPLGDVTLLLSSTPGGVAAQPATIDAIVEACAAWKIRCDEDPNNVALFFFCGHGMMRTGNALLASDFGSSALNPFEQALDFEKLRLGMGSCKASTQLFLIDSCRSSSASLRAQLDLDARVPIPPRIDAPPVSDHLVLNATAPLELAYGEAGQPSRFTAALIACLRGLGARKRNGTWQVTTADLGLAVTRTLARMCRLADAPLQIATPSGSPRGAVVCELGPVAPRVPLTVELSPDAAATLAALDLVRRSDGSVVETRPPSAGAWTIEIAAGVYDLAARFSAPATYKDAKREEIYVLPPDAEERIEVV